LEQAHDIFNVITQANSYSVSQVDEFLELLEESGTTYALILDKKITVQGLESLCLNSTDFECKCVELRDASKSRKFISNSPTRFD
jgi:hypothetical protein